MLDPALEGQQLGGAAHDIQLVAVHPGRIGYRHAMTVDGRELHERINGIERHEVHAKRREEVLKGHLQSRQTAMGWARQLQYYPHVEV